MDALLRRQFRRMAVVLAAPLVLWGCATQSTAPAPSPLGERVRWAPGHVRHMEVGDVGCTADARPGLRQRIVNAAAAEWRRFDYPIIDTAEDAGERRVPLDHGVAIIPDAVNPLLPPSARRRVATRMGLMEDTPSAMLAIGGYWAVTDPDQIRRQNRIWAIDPAAGWAAPWSAAFVSFVMCEAGLSGAQFPRSKAHLDYIAYAFDATPGGAYRFQRNGDGPIEPGDLVCSWRGVSVPMDFSVGRAQLAQPDGPVGSHCDIVVRVDEERGRLYAIGGNVAQAVSMSIVGLTGEAHRRLEAPPDFPGARAWFGVLRLSVEGSGTARLEDAFAAP